MPKGLKQRRADIIDYGRPLMRDTSDVREAAKLGAMRVQEEARNLASVSSNLQAGLKIYEDHQRYKSSQNKKSPERYKQFENIVEDKISKLPWDKRTNVGFHRKAWNSVNVEVLNQQYGMDFTQAEVDEIKRWGNKNKIFKTQRQVGLEAIDQIRKSPSQINYDKEKGELNIKPLSDSYKDVTGKDIKRILTDEEYTVLEGSKRVSDLKTYLGNAVATDGPDSLSLERAYVVLHKLKKEGKLNDVQSAEVTEAMESAASKALRNKEYIKKIQDERLLVDSMRTDVRNEKAIDKISIKAKDISNPRVATAFSRSMAKKVYRREKEDVLQRGQSLTSARRQLQADLNDRNIISKDRDDYEYKFREQVEKTVYDSLFFSEGARYGNVREPKTPTTGAGYSLAEKFFSHLTWNNPAFKAADYPAKKEAVFKDVLTRAGLDVDPTLSVANQMDKLGEILDAAKVNHNDFVQAIVLNDQKKLNEINEVTGNKLRNEIKKLKIPKTMMKTAVKKPNKVGIVDRFKSWIGGFFGGGKEDTPKRKSGDTTKR